jgi:hypothetical protein
MSTTNTAEVKYLDRVPPGWFVLDVMQAGKRKRVHWAALIIDVDPDDLKGCQCDFPALFYVHPKDYKPGTRKTSQGWFRIPGKYKSKDLAWEALEEMMATRH